MFPSDVLKLGAWILQVADKENKKIQFIANLKDYADDHFYVDVKQVHFKTHSDGPHTSDSSHPRTELRSKTTFDSSHDAELYFTFQNRSHTKIPICVAQVLVPDQKIEVQLLVTGSSIQSVFNLQLRHFDKKHTDLGNWFIDRNTDVVLTVVKGKLSASVTQNSKTIRAGFKTQKFEGAYFKVGNYFQSKESDKTWSDISVSKLRTTFHL